MPAEARDQQRAAEAHVGARRAARRSATPAGTGEARARRARSTAAARPSRRRRTPSSRRPPPRGRRPTTMPDDRVHRLERPLTGELHAPVEHPQRRLERQRRQHEQQHEAGGDDPRLVVDHGQQRDRRGDEQPDRDVERRLERERALEGELLVVLVLLDVGVRDAHLLEPRQRPEADEQDAPDAVVRRREEEREQKAAGQPEQADHHREAAVDQRAARRVLAQAAPPQVEAPGRHRARACHKLLSRLPRCPT